MPRAVVILPDHAHLHAERRFRAIGRTRLGRPVFVVFTMRDRDGTTRIRPIGARYMRAAEIDAYDEANPKLRDR